MRWSGWRRSPRWRRNEHAYVLVQAHGEAGWTGRLVPLTVDGLIYASSMVMLDSVRRGSGVPALAVVVRLGHCRDAGCELCPRPGPWLIGAAEAAWPAVTLAGSYELLMVIIRGA